MSLAKLTRNVTVVNVPVSSTRAYRLTVPATVLRSDVSPVATVNVIRSANVASSVESVILIVASVPVNAVTCRLPIAPNVDAAALSSDAKFAVGRFGQALLCGPAQPLIHYVASGNLMAPSGTISMWVKPLNWTQSDGYFHVFFEAGGHDAKVGWLILYKYYQSGWLLLRYADEQRQVGMATMDKERLRPGEWHHIAGTWSTHALRIYIDGRLAAAAPAGRRGGEVGGQHGSARGHAAVDQPVREVSAISLKRALAQPEPMDHHAKHVVQWDSQYNQRHEHAEGGKLLRWIVERYQNGEHAQRKTKRQTARVS